MKANSAGSTSRTQPGSRPTVEVAEWAIEWAKEVDPAAWRVFVGYIFGECDRPVARACRGAAGRGTAPAHDEEVAS